MTATTQQRRSPLGLFPDKPAPRLYDRMVEVLRVRRYSRRTEDAYVYWIRRYIEFHDRRHPRELDESDVMISRKIKREIRATDDDHWIYIVLLPAR